MNKTIRLFLFVGLIALTVISCKPKQIVTEIKSAKEPAATTVPVQTAVQETPKPVDSEPVVQEVTRAESFSLAAGETNTTEISKKYHVQVGAFSIHSNAINLRDKLVAEGNNAFVVENESGMLRVIIASFDEYKDAHAKIDQIKGTYPDAWVLIRKK